jgi:hypothetical protein
MKRNTDKQLEYIKGGMSYWERINHNPDFVKAKRKLQARYGLPLPFDIFRQNNKGWRDWLKKRGREFCRELKSLFDGFGIPDEWRDDLLGVIAGTPFGHSLEVSGHPMFEIYRSNGGWEWRCIITPQTDLTNPLILELIRDQQKLYASPPPKPERDKNNPRKTDWYPVYEWHKTHPLFTIREIADSIGYEYQTVRKAFADIERNYQQNTVQL